MAERLGRGEIELQGTWFDVERAELHVFRVAEGRFVRVDEEMIARELAKRAAATRPTTRGIA